MNIINLTHFITIKNLMIEIDKVCERKVVLLDSRFTFYERWRNILLLQTLLVSHLCCWLIKTGIMKNNIDEYHRAAQLLRHISSVSDSECERVGAGAGAARDCWQCAVVRCQSAVDCERTQTLVSSFDPSPASSFSCSLLCDIYKVI